MCIMNKDELKAFRREMISRMEQRLAKSRNPEDDLFYCHPSEDRIVLSHALFWVMTDSVKGKIRKEKNLLLLRQYYKRCSPHGSRNHRISKTCCITAM